MAAAATNHNAGVPISTVLRSPRAYLSAHVRKILSGVESAAGEMFREKKEFARSNTNVPASNGEVPPQAPDQKQVAAFFLQHTVDWDIERRYNNLSTSRGLSFCIRSAKA